MQGPKFLPVRIIILGTFFGGALSWREDVKTFYEIESLKTIYFKYRNMF